MGKIINVARIGGRNTDCDCETILNRFERIENEITNIENKIQFCDCEEFHNRITNIENDITNIKNDIVNIKNEITVGSVKCVTRTTANTPNTGAGNQVLGLGVCSINIGSLYNFWGTGTVPSGASWSGGTRYYFAYPVNPVTGLDEFPKLSLYEGDVTVGTAWFTTGGGQSYSTPIYIDSTGIYLYPTNTLNPNTGSYFRFTVTLILG